MDVENDFHGSRLSDGIVEAFALAGRTAVATGAASGIGRKTALILAEAGANVVISDVDDAGLGETARLAERRGILAPTSLTNVANRAEVYALADHALAETGRVDIWVNVADIILSRAILKANESDLDRLLAINLEGVYWGCAAAGRAMKGAGSGAIVPAMAARGAGSIVNIASIDGLDGVAHLSSYVATKFAVTSMTKALALELGDRGIRVNSLHPGIVDATYDRNMPAAAMERPRKAIARQPLNAWRRSMKSLTPCCFSPRTRVRIAPAPNWWSMVGIWRDHIVTRSK